MPLKNVLVTGAYATPETNNAEVAGDIEFAMAIAPALDRITVYEGGSNTHGSSLLNRMATDNSARQLSSSWDYGFNNTDENILLEFAAQGQTFFQASGDRGAYDWSDLQEHEGHPSDSPALTSVGGTSLATAGRGGGWKSEKSWGEIDNADGNYCSSGGGVSDIYALPEWQTGLDLGESGGSTNMRNFPDVSIIASGLWFVWNKGAKDEYFSGTSAGAPIWAGIAALINEQAERVKMPPVGFLNPALYKLGKSAMHSPYYHDIVTGNNTNPDSPNQYYAVPGYDLCTGWGTPKGSNLINTLVTMSFPKPSIRIVEPLAGLSVGTNILSVSGTTKSRTAIGTIFFQLNSNHFGAPFTTNLWTNWTTNVTLQPGTNTIRAFAMDSSSNVSDEVALQLRYVDLQPIDLEIAPQNFGGITSSFNGTNLEVGLAYTIRALPAKGNVFSNWTGSILSTNNPLHFVMQSNMVLQANFASNYYLGAQGAYSGLFCVSNEISYESSGMLSGLKIGPQGSFTARVLTKSESYAVAGRFDISGNATNRIARAASQGGPVTMALSLKWTTNPPQVTGVITCSNQNWTANLLALRAAQWPASAEFTMLLAPLTNDPSAVPPGYGYALMTNHLGRFTLNGALADGSTFSESVAVSQEGLLPIFATAHPYQGFLMGWLDLGPKSLLSSGLTWIKSPSHATKLYTDGFMTSVAAIISVWTNPPAHEAALPMPLNLDVVGGDLTANLSLGIDFNAENSFLTNFISPGYESSSLDGAVNAKTGLVTFAITNKGPASTMGGAGAFLQNTSFGGGFFLGKTNVGSFILSPSSPNP